MRIKSFIASTVQEALASVKREMGDSSIILETRSIEEGDIKSTSGQVLVEVVAAENISRNGSIPEATQNEESSQMEERVDSNEEKMAFAMESRGMRGDSSDLISSLTEQRQQDATRATLCQKEKFLTAQDLAEMSENQMNNDTLGDHLLKEDLVELAGYSTIENIAIPVRKKSENVNSGVWTGKCKELYYQLRAQQVEKEHSGILINEALSRMSGGDYDRIDMLRLSIKKCIMSKIAIPESYSQNPDTGRTMVFIGSAGAGKTTTISKLATDMRKRSDKDIVLISVRGSSVEKLKKTAGLIGAKVRTVTSCRELRDMREKYENSSHLLIDTPGISHIEKDGLSNIREILEDIQNAEMHIVASATTRYVDITNTIRRYPAFPVQRLLFTRIDETGLYGTLLSVAMQTKIPLSFVTDGQEIPEDIRPVTAEMIADMVLQA